jgi:hypothetical protein
MDSVNEQQPWAIRLTILASDAEADAIFERVSRVICADPDHDGPCLNPWSMTRIAVADLDSPERAAWASAVQELLEQREAESRDP